MNILIADDHALFRDSLRSLLSARGLEVVGEAKNGREAVELTLRLRPDVVLMDLAMPELSGMALLGQMQDDPDLATIPVIVLTAHTGRSMQEEILRRGAKRYLVKTDVALKDIVKLASDLLNSAYAA